MSADMLLAGLREYLERLAAAEVAAAVLFTALLLPGSIAGSVVAICTAAARCLPYWLSTAAGTEQLQCWANAALQCGMCAHTRMPAVFGAIGVEHTVT